MKIAVPVFGSRVSPRFDCAQVFLLVTAQEGHRLQRQELVAADWTPHERINRLMELGVNAVICGGIDWWSAQALRSAGILVCNAVKGDVDEALNALLRGDMIANERFPTPATSDGVLGGEEHDAAVGQADGTSSPQYGQETRKHQDRRGGSGGRGACS